MAQKVYMNNGNGKHAYGFGINSTPQRNITNALVFPVLDEALQQVSLPTGGKPIVVADLGCASGPNTIVNISYIVDTLRSRCLESTEMPSEFQIYFNDLAGNDFNSLFKLLCDNEADRSKFYVAGVPGSFFDRLFPRSSVHIFVSMLSVHFLSRTPDSVTDENSLAFNKGNLWLEGSADATAQAYKDQSSLDLKSFLQARCEELVPGGLLYFIVKTRTASKANALRPTEDSVDALQICFRETAEEVFSKGILTEEQLDVVNVPLYFSLFEEELLEIVKSFNSTFEILTAEEMRFPLFMPPGSSSGNEFSDPNPVISQVIAFARSIFGCIFEQVMGNEEHEIFWQHFAQIAKKYASALGQDCHFGCIALLKK